MLIDKRLVEDIRLGNSISDEELKAARKFYKNLTESLECLGAEFKIQADETRRTFYRLDSYHAARKRMV